MNTALKVRLTIIVNVSVPNAELTGAAAGFCGGRAEIVMRTVANSIRERSNKLDEPRPTNNK